MPLSFSIEVPSYIDVEHVSIHRTHFGGAEAWQCSIFCSMTSDGTKIHLIPVSESGETAQAAINAACATWDDRVKGMDAAMKARDESRAARAAQEPKG